MSSDRKVRVGSGRDFAAAGYAAGRFVTVLGDTILQISVPFYILSTGGGLMEVGLVQAARWLPVLFVTLWGGVIGDRLNRRMVVLVTDVVGASAAAVVGVCGSLLATPLAYYGVGFGMAMVGMSSAIRNPSLAGLLKSIAGTINPHQVVARNSLGVGIASALGPALGGVMIGVLPIGVIAAVNATTYLAGLGLVLFATASLVQRRDVRPQKRTMSSDLSEGFALVWRMPWLVLGILSSALYQLLFIPSLFVLGPGYAHEFMENGPIAWGAAMGAMGIGSITGGLVAGRWKAARPAPTSVVLSAVTPVATIALALQAPLVIVLAGFLLMGAATTVAGALWMTAVIQSVDEAHVSRVASVDIFGSLLFKPIGQATVAPLAALLTTSVAMLTLGVTAMLVQFATSLKMRQLDPKGDKQWVD